MALQPYEIANFNLIEFASIYNKFVDTHDPEEIETQWMDKDGNINTIKIQNVAFIKEMIKSNITDETQARITADQELDQKIIQVKTDLSNQLSEEIQNRVNGDKTLQDNIDKAVQALTNNINNIETNLENEVTRATEAEKTLEDKITQEVNDRIEADKNLDDKLTQAINNEADTREAADDNLNNKIDNVNNILADKINQEIQDRINGDNQTLIDTKTYTDNNIKNEADERKAADGDLQFNDDIRNEDGTTPSNLTDAINDVDNKIENEIKIKINEVTNKVEAILAGANADLDSFKELVDYINSIDAEDDEALSTFIKDTLSKFTILFNSIGIDENGYNAPDQAHYINNANSLYDADKELDNALYVVSNNIAAEINRAKTAEGDLQFNDDIKNEDGSTPDNLTDAINDVDNNLKILRNEFDNLGENLKVKTDVKDDDGNPIESLVEILNTLNKRIEDASS